MILGVSLDGVPLPHGTEDRARLAELVEQAKGQAPASRIAVRILAAYILLVTGGSGPCAAMKNAGAALRYAERRMVRLLEREAAAA